MRNRVLAHAGETRGIEDARMLMRLFLQLNNSPDIIFRIVCTEHRIQMSTTAMAKIVPRISKKGDGISVPIVSVANATVPSGKVNAHHPILKGNLLVKRWITAIASHTIAKPHISKAIMNPAVYRMVPELVFAWSRVFVSGKIFLATAPSFWME